MPAGPMMKCRLAANSAAVNRSIASTVAYGAPALHHGNSNSTSNSKRPAIFNRRSAGRNGDSTAAALRLGACGRPSKPQGRTTSTTAITRNSATKVNLENEKSTPNHCTVPMPTHSALISAISSAAM
jgi:hypothetical protein